jgi:hypothetical protein
MKYLLSSFLLLSILIFIGKHGFPHQPRPLLSPTDTDTLVIGDINNDKIIDTAFIVGPKWINDEEGWGDPKVTPYEVDINFSCGLPSIHDDNAVMGYIENIGDIDGDHISEVIVLPIWFIGCWGRMKFYTYKEGQWRYFGEAECHICNDEKYINRITKLSKNKISVIEDAWDSEAAERVKKSKTIKISEWRTANKGRKKL